MPFPSGSSHPVELQIWANVRTKLASLNELQVQVEQSIQEVKALEAEYARLQEQQPQQQQQPSDGGSDDTEPGGGAEAERRRGEVAEKLQAAYAKLTEESKAEKRWVHLSTGSPRIKRMSID